MTQPEPAKTPEPCTTSSHRKRHLSRELEPSRRGSAPGRYGRTLCGQSGRDQERVNYDLPTGWLKRVVVADLPPCSLCERSARAAVRDA